MNKEELLNELNSMINDEMSIVNLQSDDFNEDLLKTLWRIKEMVMELESMYSPSDELIDELMEEIG